MLSKKARKKLEKAKERAEGMGNYDSAAHKMLAQNPVEGVTPRKRKKASKEKMKNG